MPASGAMPLKEIWYVPLMTVPAHVHACHSLYSAILSSGDLALPIACVHATCNHACNHAPHHAGFRGFAGALEVHLVEVSPALRGAQWAALRCSPAGSSGGSGGGAAGEQLAAAVRGSSGGAGASEGRSSGVREQAQVGVSGWNGATVGLGLQIAVTLQGMLDVCACMSMYHVRHL